MDGMLDYFTVHVASAFLVLFGLRQGLRDVSPPRESLIFLHHRSRIHRLARGFAGVLHVHFRVTRSWGNDFRAL